MTMSLQRIAQYHCETGEGPLWHTGEHRLYWTDIPAGRLFRFDPARQHHELIYRGRPVGGFTVQEDGALLLFRDKGNVVLWRDGHIAHTLSDALPGEESHRFNDVAADPRGRVFCGTMPLPGGDPRRAGSLCRLDPDGSIRVVLEGVGCSNGIGWSPDLQRMYYIDTPTHRIDVFDYDSATGDIANRREFAPVQRGLPDGMTVDAEGGVWVALWGGSGVLRLDDAGKLVQILEIPAKNPSSVMFGGADLKDLYITTAIGGEKNPDPEHDGALFCCRPGVMGKPEFRSRIESGVA